MNALTHILPRLISLSRTARVGMKLIAKNTLFGCRIHETNPIIFRRTNFFFFFLFESQKKIFLSPPFSRLTEEKIGNFLNNNWPRSLSSQFFFGLFLEKIIFKNQPKNFSCIFKNTVSLSRMFS